MDMKSSYRLTLVLLATLMLGAIIAPTQSHAGAWSQKKGHYYTRPSSTAPTRPLTQMATRAI
jgi:hypothetical protein